MLHLRVRDSGEYFIYYGPSIIAPVMLEKELHEGRDFCFVHGSSPQGSALFGLCTIWTLSQGSALFGHSNAGSCLESPLHVAAHHDIQVLYPL